MFREDYAVSNEITELKHKIQKLEASAVYRHSEPTGGTLIDLQTQVKGRLPLENVNVDPIIEALKSIVKAVENLESRMERAAKAKGSTT